MAAGGARRGRRDNGLDATEYAVAGDVDPRVGEHLLDVLAAGGIAAYLQPSADLNPVTRTTTIPPRPTDRLYVDRAHLDVARDHLAKLAEAPQPERDVDVDVEAEWQRIVAGFHTDVAERTPPWPAAEDATPSPTADPGEPLTDATRVSGVTLGRRQEEPSLLDGLDTFGADLPGDDDDEGYTPPPPPPLPRISRYAVLGIVAIIGGFVLFLFPSLLPADRGITTLLGFTAILAGFVTLIWRLRSGDDEEDDPDDGAVV
ncbi:DUF308 domain-containing protein [Phytohabitans sp. ZYX-F-186]|uniref:DUF308 domain-containing protein n=1 Tax=Phytohabitans maris TaxID=3071409 RepID=A0ABU0ZFI2_9ACTN|nr:DUF308 domain-containing protein [Phytohabitans sp. ZYX-F-186]MDQ7905820.1 DUF308 domain-containing protein [Phytohabitans sp. ZYX-F-186]